jgi:hypothetical protein
MIVADPEGVVQVASSLGVVLVVVLLLYHS